MKYTKKDLEKQIQKVNIWVDRYKKVQSIIKRMSSNIEKYGNKLNKAYDLEWKIEQIYHDEKAKFHQIEFAVKGFTAY